MISFYNSGAWHKNTERYVYNSGAWHKTKERYAYDSGAWHKTFSSGKKLSDLPVGSLLKINENGVPQQYIIVNQGNPDATIYDASCNGTWVLRKEIIIFYSWGSTGDCQYSASNNVKNYIDVTYLNLLDNKILSTVKDTIIPYYIIASNTQKFLSDGLQVKAFILGARELGATNTIPSRGAVLDGAKLDYFDSGDSDSANAKRIANYGTQLNHFYWTRSGFYNYGAIAVIRNDGNFSEGEATTGYGIRPAMILNSTALVSSSPDSDNCYILQ